ncbi:PDR/VanB family oxidoreductase [Enemella evansiae]|uniref:Oxidoreductase n=1 Tax=Enemella evansiae TaxID=2016499 RepID=A0A255GPZ7_9ACTN|nr:PDR/VanB family oxidoreductase [Enemella evansiae]PFG68687.1 ferredoxin-NADP reductase [Propionibacteriaceae bacterium ES.041]OYN94025.1 oxidoreductase [Enemella evansiae]OYO03414.1 oxidoreductase [Enemella evansiae]OYO09346.1 oxidoreductase [Enemella evansiae]OYO09835.1 oxidoreductase [Enemella evansiae]
MESGSIDERRTLRVFQKRWEATGITSITLVDPAGRPLPGWQPGAHLALHLPNGMVREYSLCSDPADDRQWTVAVLRTVDSRGGSSLIHDQLPIGAEIEVEGPRNAFRLENADATTPVKHYLIAGGIGITPIIAMARELNSRGADWALLYTGRSRPQLAFLDEVEGLPSERVHVHIDDEVGRFPDLTALLSAQDPQTIVYCCGPGPLMDAVADAMPVPANLRLERFQAPTREVDPDAEQDRAFDVVLHSTGARFPVAADESILDALGAAGVDVPSSCLEGICGTCETGVISGELDHRDFLLTDEEKESGETMCLCVSRCRGSELVLDL